MIFNGFVFPALPVGDENQEKKLSLQAAETYGFLAMLEVLKDCK